MHAQREIVYKCLLFTQVEDTDLGVRDTTTEPRFWIRLVFTIPVAARK